MRLRFATAAVLLLPAVADAQRIRLPFGPGRQAPPTELPTHAPGISPVRSIPMYKFSRLSYESYQMINFMSTPGYVAAGPSSYVSLAGGARLDFRVAPSLSLTADATQSLLGGPFGFNTYDLGGRVKPFSSPRLKPYVDARWSYARAGGYGTYEEGVSTIPMTSAIMSHGSGRVFGLGFETPITTRFSLNTGLAATNYTMNARQYTSGRGFETWTYKMDAVRWVIAGRFNPGRWTGTQEQHY